MSKEKQLYEILRTLQKGEIGTDLAHLQILRLFSVVGPSEQLLEEQSNWLMANTSLEVEKIVDFKEHFK